MWVVLMNYSDIYVLYLLILFSVWILCRSWLISLIVSSQVKGPRLGWISRRMFLDINLNPVYDPVTSWTWYKFNAVIIKFWNILAFVHLYVCMCWLDLGICFFKKFLSPVPSFSYLFMPEKTWYTSVQYARLPLKTWCTMVASFPSGNFHSIRYIGIVYN